MADWSSRAQVVNVPASIWVKLPMGGLACPSVSIQVPEVKSPPSVSRRTKPIICAPLSKVSENQSQPVWVSDKGCDDHSRSSQAFPVTLRCPSGSVIAPVTEKRGCE